MIMYPIKIQKKARLLLKRYFDISSVMISNQQMTRLEV